MKIDRAIEILDPEHREHYDGMEEVNEACWMGMEALKRTRWIPVSERPPVEKGWYLVYAPYYSGGSSSGLCNINGKMFAKWNGKNWSIEVGYHKRPGCVTHWMPLPEPPEEDPQDEKN